MLPSYYSNQERAVLLAVAKPPAKAEKKNKVAA